jgi:serine/threonine protein phosphatase 1
VSATLTYAIGDIHGSFTKLENLLEHCVAYRGSGDPSRMIFLGEYVDRGRHSRQVVELLMTMQASAPDEIICLSGNHEDMLVAAARQGGTYEVHWLLNGGDATLESYGVGSADDIPPAHLAWFAALPLTFSDERRLYVHAGIMPGLPLDQQTKEHALWIREPFLSDPRDHGVFVVHGHTPSRSGTVELRPNRLNLDTGAYYGGPLTAAVFNDTTRGPIAFITDDGRITEAPQPTDMQRA